MRPTRPLLAAALAILLGGTAPAAATTLTFAQEGFAAGGRLAFTIAGTDASGDGVLERMDRNPIEETTGFGLQFAGNTLIRDFSLGLADLLVFNPNLATLDFLDLGAIQHRR